MASTAKSQQNSLESNQGSDPDADIGLIFEVGEHDNDMDIDIPLENDFDSLYRY